MRADISPPIGQSAVQEVPVGYAPILHPTRGSWQGLIFLAPTARGLVVGNLHDLRALFQAMRTRANWIGFMVSAMIWSLTAELKLGVPGVLCHIVDEVLQGLHLQNIFHIRNELWLDLGNAQAARQAPILRMQLDDLRRCCSHDGSNEPSAKEEQKMATAHGQDVMMSPAAVASTAMWNLTTNQSRHVETLMWHLHASVAIITAPCGYSGVRVRGLPVPMIMTGSAPVSTVGSPAAITDPQAEAKALTRIRTRLGASAAVLNGRMSARSRARSRTGTRIAGLERQDRCQKSVPHSLRQPCDPGSQRTGAHGFHIHEGKAKQGRGAPGLRFTRSYVRAA